MPESIAAHLASPRPDAPGIDIDPDALGGWRFHAIARRRVAVHRGSDPDEQGAEIIVAIAPGRDHGSFSIVSTPRSLRSDLHRLADAMASPASHGASPGELPIAFSGGSAAVLMHEAVGHPSERRAPHVAWPAWLEVTDDPFATALGHLPLDDCGRPVAKRELTRGESPSALRRWSFRDTPIVRMSNLRVTGSGVPASLPSTRIDVQLVDQGGWDPLTEQVALRISLAELVDGRHRTLLPRFTFRATRREIAARLAGWFGEPTSYPGVICSDEGQTLPVGSIATGLLLLPR
jgi:hypothetical protein